MHYKTRCWAGGEGKTCGSFSQPDNCSFRNCSSITPQGNIHISFRNNHPESRGHGLFSIKTQGILLTHVCSPVVSQYPNGTGKQQCCQQQKRLAIHDQIGIMETIKGRRRSTLKPTNKSRAKYPTITAVVGVRLFILEYSNIRKQKECGCYPASFLSHFPPILTRSAWCTGCPV